MTMVRSSSAGCPCVKAESRSISVARISAAFRSRHISIPTQKRTSNVAPAKGAVS
jgi:hypothetical protein